MLLPVLGCMTHSLPHGYSCNQRATELSVLLGRDINSWTKCGEVNTAGYSTSLGKNIGKSHVCKRLELIIKSFSDLHVQEEHQQSFSTIISRCLFVPRYKVSRLELGLVRYQQVCSASCTTPQANQAQVTKAARCCHQFLSLQ